MSKNVGMGCNQRGATAVSAGRRDAEVELWTWAELHERAVTETLRKTTRKEEEGK